MVCGATEVTLKNVAHLSVKIENLLLKRRSNFKIISSMEVKLVHF